MINMGLVGCGYWGPNYIRVLNALKEARLRYCCDLNKANLVKIKRQCPDIRTTTDYGSIAKNPAVDAVIITTPGDSHYKIAKSCITNGKHVLVEKPFVSTSKEAMELIRIARKEKVVLMVGHIYEYHPGIMKLKEIIEKGTLGEIFYGHAERAGLGPIRKYANVLWDLATHDIAIALYILNEFPREVDAVGGCYLQKKVDDIVFLNLRFPSGAIYNIYASWIAPEKIRKTTVVGSKGMSVFDDVNKAATLRIYERTIHREFLDSTPEYTDHQLMVTIGDSYLPEIEESEPMANQVRHFLECIVKEKAPLTDGEDGLRVVRILEAAQTSLKCRKAVKCR